MVAPKLPTALRERIAQLMRDKRRDFGALATRFPVPSATDVRQTALNLETLARNDSLKAETLSEVLTMLAALEHDVGQEIGATTRRWSQSRSTRTTWRLWLLCTTRCTQASIST